MTSRDDAVRRSLRALRPEAADEHPGTEALAAYVEGRLSADERAAIARLAASSPTVAEDLADLQAVHRTLSAQPAARRDVRWGRAAAIAAIAASAVLGVWLTRPTGRVEVPPAVTRLEQGEQDRVRQAIARGRLELTPSAAGLRSRDGMLLGSAAPASFGPLSPVGTAVLSRRPTFTWSSNGADAYTVAIFDEHFTEVARSPRLQATSWTPSVDLALDGRYVWQVTAHRGTVEDTEPKPPRAEARFAVTNATIESEMKRTIARLKDEPLALGILLAEYGFIDDGRAALQRAAGDRRTADDARRLLESLDQGTPMATKPAQ